MTTIKIDTTAYSQQFYAIISDAEVLIDGNWVPDPETQGHFTGHGRAETLEKAQMRFQELNDRGTNYRVFTISNSQPDLKRRQVNLRITICTETTVQTYAPVA